MNRSAAGVLAGLLAVSAGTAAVAQRRGVLRGPDRQFVIEAAQGGRAEVALGRLAQQRAGSAAVRRFGKRMVDDHSRANQELRDRSVSEGFRPPAGMGEHTALYNRLSRLSGSGFDRVYMSEMVDDHRKDVAAFQSQARTGRNASIREFARNTLPVLREHLRMARDIARSVGAPRAGMMR